MLNVYIESQGIRGGIRLRNNKVLPESSKLSNVSNQSVSVNVSSAPEHSAVADQAHHRRTQHDLPSCVATGSTIRGSFLAHLYINESPPRSSIPRDFRNIANGNPNCHTAAIGIRLLSELCCATQLYKILIV